MSRLYVWLMTDMQKIPEITREARNNIALRVNYGSKKDSKEAVNIAVHYPDGADKPEVYVTITEGIKHQVIILP